VILTGSNWQPGESVHIHVNDDVGQTWSRDVDVTADENGAIRDEFQLPDWFVATYNVTATGAQSGVATTSFTDGNVAVENGEGTPSDLTANYTLTGFDAGPDNQSCTPDDVQSNQGNRNKTFNVTGQFNGGASGSGNQVASGDTQSVKVTFNSVNGNYAFKQWKYFDGNPNSTRRQSANQTAHSTQTSFCFATENNTNRTFVAYFTRIPVAHFQHVTTDEDTSKLITLTATDPGNDPLTYKVISLPLNGKLYKGNSTAEAHEITSASLGNPVTLSSNQVTYKPNDNYNGGDNFVFRANDGTADSNPAPVPITVNPVNDEPLANNDTKTMNEDGAPLSIDFGALVSDVETSDANLTYNIGSPNPSGSLSGTGSTRNFTPAANFNGTVNINYTVTDRGDPDNCGPASPAFCTAAKTSAQKTVTITVNPVNDAPVLATIGDKSTNEGQQLSFNANAPDPDNDTVTYSLVAGENCAGGETCNVPSGASIGSTSGAFSTPPPTPNYYSHPRLGHGGRAYPLCAPGEPRLQYRPTRFPPYRGRRRAARWCTPFDPHPQSG
jgi:Bacterial Ig domain/Bacterial cadherin-like domain